MPASGIRFTGDWKKARNRLGRLNRLAYRNVYRASEINADRMENRIKRVLRKGDSSWEPLSPLTAMRKGHEQPLRDTGALEAAIKTHVINRTDLLIGVKRGAKTESGVNLMKIAAAMEFGKITRPKTAQVLAIPVSKEAQELEINYGGIRNIPGIFHPKGSRVLAIKSGKQLKVLFVLAEYTVTPPRSFILKTYRKYKGHIIRRYRTAVRYAIQGRRYG